MFRKVLAMAFVLAVSAQVIPTTAFAQYGGGIPSIIGIVNVQKTDGIVLGASTYQFNKKLAVGSRGDDVIELQKYLTKKGFYRGMLTGYFGPLTLATVKAFQKKNSIPETGLVGPLTRAVLNRG